MYTVTREVVSTSNEHKSGYDSFEDDPEERYYNSYHSPYRPQQSINFGTNYHLRNGNDDEMDGEIEDNRIYETENGHFPSSSSYKCTCCPYGYHVDLGFLKTADGHERNLNMKNLNSTSNLLNGHFQSTGSNPKTDVSLIGALGSFGPLGPINNPDGGVQRYETVNVSEDGMTTTRVIEEHTRTTTTTIDVLDDDEVDDRVQGKRMPALERAPRRPSLTGSTRSNSPDEVSRNATILRQQQLDELYRRLQEITPIDQSGNHQTYVVTGNEPDYFQEVPKFQTSVQIPAVNGVSPDQQRHITQTTMMITQENKLMNDRYKRLEDQLADLAEENERLRRQMNTMSVQSQPYQPLRVLEKELNTEETTEIREKQLKTIYLAGEEGHSLATASSSFGRGQIRESPKSVRNIGVGDGNVFDNSTSSMEVHEHELRTVFIGGPDDGKAKQTRNVGILCRPAMRDVGMVHVSEDSHIIPYKPNTEQEEYAYLSGLSLAQGSDGQVAVGGQGQGGEDGGSFFTSAGFCNTSFSSYAGGIGGLKGLNLSPEQLRKLLDEMLKREVHSVGSQCQFSTESKAVDATHSGYDMISIGVSSDSIDVEVIPIRIMKTVAIDHRPSLFHRCCGTDSVYKIDTGTSTRALGMSSNRGTNTDSKVMYPAATNTDASLMPKESDGGAANSGRRMVTTTKVITSGGGSTGGYSTTKVVTNKSSSSSSRVGGTITDDDATGGFNQSNELSFHVMGDSSMAPLGRAQLDVGSIGLEGEMMEQGNFSTNINPRIGSSRIVEDRNDGASTGGSYSTSTTIRSGSNSDRRSSGLSSGSSRKTVTFQDDGPGLLLGLGGGQRSSYSTTNRTGVVIGPPEISSTRTTETTTEHGSKRTVYDGRGGINSGVGSSGKFNSDGSHAELKAVVTEYFEPGKSKKVVTETVDKDGKRYVVDSRYETNVEAEPLTATEIEARNLASNAKEIVVTESVGPAGMKKIVTVAIDKDGTRRTIDTRLEPIGDQSERIISSSSSVSRSHGGKMNVFSEEGSRFTHLSPSLNFYSTWLKDPGTTSAQEMEDSLEKIKENWFSIVASGDASADNVHAFLLYLGHFTPQLATRIVNMTDSNGNSALHYALSNKNADVVGALLDSRLCDVDQRNSVGYSAVMMGALCDVATDTKMAAVVNKLFKMGNVNATAAQAKQTALMMAAERGRLDTIEILLKCGADINVQDATGISALMYAAEHGHENVVTRLLKVPTCKSDLLNNDGGSALSISKDAGHTSISKLIEEHLKKLKK